MQTSSYLLASLALSAVVAALPATAQTQSHVQAPAAAAGALTDAHRIAQAMKSQFNRPDAPLDVAPISIEGRYAVAGWVQGDRGGRALLKKEGDKWWIEVCAGDGLKSPDALAMAGLDKAGAARLASKIQVAEARLPAAQVRKFALFEGTVNVRQQPDHHHGASATHR